jgi:hypothetical protein
MFVFDVYQSAQRMVLLSPVRLSLAICDWPRTRARARMNSRLTAVILSLIASAVIALAFTAGVSFLLIKLGIAGFGHMVALMIVMPLSFAIAAWLFARKFVLGETDR